MDINDILASVTRSHAASRPSTDTNDPLKPQSDLQSLTRAWVSERTAPELLPYPSTLIDRVMANIRAQITAIEDNTALMNAGTSFTLIVQQTELERFKFLLRSFLRARIAKIDAHPDWYLSLHTQQQSSQSQPSQRSSFLDAQSVDEGYTLLSPTEQTYLTRHIALLRNHYNAAFLSSFPQKLRRLDDKVGGSSGGGGSGGMIEGPDVDKAVWVRCLGRKRAGGLTNGRSGQGTGYDTDDDFDDGRVVLEDGDHIPTRSDETPTYAPVPVSCGFTRPRRKDAKDGDDHSMGGKDEGGGERVIQMQRGEIWVVRWRDVREMVSRGACELL